MTALRHPYLALLALAISGAASLMLEQLWFEWLALHWGRTADAAAATLASFMLGLGLGQWLIMHPRWQAVGPSRLWAVCELLVGLSAAVCNWRLQDTAQPLPSHALLWLLLPTLLMGMTLPLAIQVFRHQRQSLSHSVGTAYALNTLGAAIGVLGCALIAIPHWGLAYSGWAAVALQLLAALSVVWAGIAAPAAQPASRAASENHSAISKRKKTNIKPLTAVFASGLLVLGMEVLWFRALLLAHRSTSENFAIMLAVVLIGLSIGSALGSKFLTENKRQPPLSTWLALQALVCGTSLLLWSPRWASDLALPNSLSLLLSALFLMLPVCIISGWLFVAASRQINQQKHRRAARQQSAKLILASTIGSTIGAPLVTLYLLPQWGWALAAITLMLIVALASLFIHWRSIPIWLVAGLVFSLLPQQWQHKQTAAASLYTALDQAKILEQADGKYQSAQLLQSQFLAAPYSYRLLTDSYSMTSTAVDSDRYMRLFAWLPQAMRQQFDDALLISYGLGTTAESLLQNPTLKTLTIADPSATVMQLSRRMQRQPEPLDDPRVQLLLEDGRQVLANHPARFDLITGEPPPPRLAGMHALYSQDYFALIRKALKPQGWTSYWLPVDQLSLASTQAIIKAFCNQFNDCSLWAGSHYNWVLLGSNNGVIEAQAHRQLWQNADAKLKQQLTTSGFESHYQLATCFIADSETLLQWAGQQAPLIDNWPRRIQPDWPDEKTIATYAHWQDNTQTAARFDFSLFASTWSLEPQRLALAWAVQPILNGQYRSPDPSNTVAQLLDSTDWQAPVLWALGADARKTTLAKGKSGAVAKLYQGVGALAERDYRTAIQTLEPLAEQYPLAGKLSRIARQRVAEKQ